ncbi:MAG: hypothetical protein ACE5I7_07245 [Candidatus Binatia bacterium]
MKWWPSRAGSLLAGATAVAVLASPSPGQLFRLGQWDGSLESVFDFSRQDITTRGFPRTRFENMRTDERLTVRNVGAYLYDPRLLSLSVGGTFGLSQRRFRAEDGSESPNGSLSGYDAVATFLSGQPFSLNLFANRVQSFPPVLGGQSEVVTENRGVTLFAQRLYIPSTLTLRQERAEQQSSTGDIVARQASERRRLTYEGRRGWTDSEMDVRYEFIDDTDKQFPTASFRSHEGNLNYSLDFGSELNWHWDSRLRYFDRTGTADVTVSIVDELLRIEHTERLRTNYRYAFTRTTTPGGTNTSHTGEAALRHQLYRSLRTNLGLYGNIETLPGGQQDTFRTRLDFTYTKRLAGKGRLNAGLGGGFEYEDDRFKTTETFVPQETHIAATPFALPLTLDNAFVITSSVVATKLAVGPLPAGCVAPAGPSTPLVLGRDYTLRATGNLTEILPVPCTGAAPGINPGDTVAVDYRFTVPTSLTFTTAALRANISLDYGWVRPYFVHEQTEQSMVAGRDGRFLDDERSDTGGVEFRYEGDRLRASVLGEARRFVSDRIVFDSLRAVQLASISIFPGLTLSLSADQTRVHFKDPTRRSQTFTGRAALSYTHARVLSADASGGVRLLQDTVFPTERTGDAALRVRWRFRNLEVGPTLEFFDRQRGRTNIREFRTLLHVIRRF